jgi:PTH1 family peptidyl-tRNA hydrolase
MNLSGEAVAQLLGFYKLTAEDLVVVCDDVSLPPGEVRVRRKGSAGGHNGLKNIISILGTDEFARVKIGIGEKPPGWDLSDYVLGAFKKEEMGLIEEGLEKAAQAVEAILAEGPDAAMRKFNKRNAKKEPAGSAEPLEDSGGKP